MNIVKAGQRAAIIVGSNKRRRVQMAMNLTRDAARIWQQYRQDMTLRVSPADMEYISFVIVERCGMIDRSRLDEMKGLACTPKVILERKGEPQRTVQNIARLRSRTRASAI